VDSVVAAAEAGEPQAVGNNAAKECDGMLAMNTKLTEFVNRLKDVAAANLKSVILYGSAARGDFREEHSDLNLLCVFESLAVEELSRVAGVIRWWSVEQKEPTPLFFTKEELQRSADVFSIEILDMQSSRRVLFGEDTVAAINVTMNLHRVQVEHELRTVILKLRQHYLRTPGDAKELTPILRKSFSGVLTLLRHTIIAFGEEAPSAAHDIIARAAALTGAKASAFDAALTVRETGSLHGEIMPVYGAYLAELEKVIRALDQHMPKGEWRRVKNATS